jgi:hypothetical protein
MNYREENRILNALSYVLAFQNTTLSAFREDSVKAELVAEAVCKKAKVSRKKFEIVVQYVTDVLNSAKKRNSSWQPTFCRRVKRTRNLDQQ